MSECDDEPCLCGTDFTCLARHDDEPRSQARHRGVGMDAQSTDSMCAIIRVPASTMTGLNSPTSSPSARFAAALFGRPITVGDLTRLITRG